MYYFNKVALENLWFIPVFIQELGVHGSTLKEENCWLPAAKKQSKTQVLQLPLNE